MLGSFPIFLFCLHNWVSDNFSWSLDSFYVTLIVSMWKCQERGEHGWVLVLYSWGKLSPEVSSRLCPMSYWLELVQIVIASERKSWEIEHIWAIFSLHPGRQTEKKRQGNDATKLASSIRLCLVSYNKRMCQVSYL